MAKKHSITNALQWHEGMLLEPHYFQQNDLRFNQLLHYYASLLSPFAWGVNKLVIDPVVLIGGVFRIIELETVFPDGLVFIYNNKVMPALELDIKKTVPTLGEVPQTVFLVVNAYRQGDGNACGELARYTSIVEGEIRDENTGDNPLIIPRLIPKVSLFMGTEVPAHYVSLPLAKVFIKENAYVLSDYIPPAMIVTKASPLAELGMRIVTRLRDKIAYLINRAQAHSTQIVVTEIREALRVFIASLPVLGAQLYAGNVSPHNLFVALAGLVGQLATLRLGTVPPVFNFYNHNDLRKSFTLIDQFVSQIIDTIQDGYSVVPFVRQARSFSLKLRPEYITSQFILGAKAPAGVSDEEMEQWVKEVVIVSNSFVKMAQDRRILGAKRTIINGDEHLGLVSARGMILFSVTNDPTAIDPNESLILFNISDREDKRPTEIVLFLERKKEFEDVAVV